MIAKAENIDAAQRAADEEAIDNYFAMVASVGKEAAQRTESALEGELAEDETANSIALKVSARSHKLHRAIEEIGAKDLRTELLSLAAICEAGVIVLEAQRLDAGQGVCA